MTQATFETIASDLDAQVPAGGGEGCARRAALISDAEEYARA